MKKITKYICDICNQEHFTEGQALHCESLGLPQDTANIKEGDEIGFWAQHKQNELGAMVTYADDKGIVLYKFATFNEKTKDHQDIMVVACKSPEGVDIERSVLMIELDKEGKKLYSPCEYIFKSGWANALKAARPQ